MTVYIIIYDWVDGWGIQKVFMHKRDAEDCVEQDTRRLQIEEWEVVG